MRKEKVESYDKMLRVLKLPGQLTLGCILKVLKSNPRYNVKLNS